MSSDGTLAEIDLAVKQASKVTLPDLCGITAIFEELEGGAAPIAVASHVTKNADLDSREHTGKKAGLVCVCVHVDTGYSLPAYISRAVCCVS